jgi:hypothetical protein
VTEAIARASEDPLAALAMTRNPRSLIEIPSVGFCVVWIVLSGEDIVITRGDACEGGDPGTEALRALARYRLRPRIPAPPPGDWEASA